VTVLADVGERHAYDDRVKPCAILSCLVALSLVTAHVKHAHAEEPATASEPRSPILLTRAALPVSVVQPIAIAPQVRDGAAMAPFAPVPKDIRLSSEATTLIIVGAVIVGVLVIVGVVALAKPHKPPGPKP
jgi:hypothetical protein